MNEGKKRTDKLLRKVEMCIRDSKYTLWKVNLIIRNLAQAFGGFHTVGPYGYCIKMCIRDRSLRIKNNG